MSNINYSISHLRPIPLNNEQLTPGAGFNQRLIHFLSGVLQINVGQIMDSHLPLFQLQQSQPDFIHILSVHFWSAKCWITFRQANFQISQRKVTSQHKNSHEFCQNLGLVQKSRMIMLSIAHNTMLFSHWHQIEYQTTSEAN